MNENIVYNRMTDLKKHQSEVDVKEYFPNGNEILSLSYYHWEEEIV